MNEAELSYLGRVAEDIETLLGREISLEEVSLERSEGRVTLGARYRLGDSAGQSEGTGRTVVAAHAALRETIVEDRIAFSLRVLVHSVR